MDIKPHPVSVAVTLTPRIVKTAPTVFVSVPGHSVREELWKTKRIELDFQDFYGWLDVRFSNKNYDECTADQDMAVIIDQVEFFGISDPKFVWQGIYRPEYPEPWYSQQTTTPKSELTNLNYLGWNGSWRLHFDVPVFTWMHRTLNLGWIYQ